MKKIILLGRSDDSKIKTRLLSEFNTKFKADSIPLPEGELVILSNLNSPRKDNILLLQLSDISGINIKNAIVIIKEKEILLTPLQLDESIYLLLNSDNEAQLKSVEGQKIPVITCGLSPKDTITFSSKDSDKSVVSLQRSLPSGSNIIEPMEIIVESKNDSEYTMLATVATGLILGLY